MGISYLLGIRSYILVLNNSLFICVCVCVYLLVSKYLHYVHLYTYGT